MRASMVDLVARTRTLIGDPESDVKQFTNDAIQAALDARRTDVVEAQLRYRPSFTDTSIVVYRDYFAPRRDWEDSVVLRDYQGTVLSPSTSDLIAGHWTFADGQALPVYITGSFYDVHGSAAALLEAWAAASAREFDFTMNAGPTQQTFSRSQKLAGLLLAAGALWRRANPPGPRPAWRSLDW